jgi:hypothetical protein
LPLREEEQQQLRDVWSCAFISRQSLRDCQLKLLFFFWRIHLILIRSGVAGFLVFVFHLISLLKEILSCSSSV